VDVDFIGQHSDLSGYRLVVAPDLVIPDTDFLARLKASGAKALFGPRSGSKTRDMHIPADLPPGPLADLIDFRVTRVESLPEFHSEPVLYGNASHPVTGWRELIRTTETVLATFEGAHRPGSPAVIGNDRARYVATLPRGEFLTRLMGDTLGWAGVASLPDLGDLRLARRGRLRFAFNYAGGPAAVPASAEAEFLVGGRTIGPADVAIWMEDEG
jgi:beta-galactosidase